MKHLVAIILVLAAFAVSAVPRVSLLTALPGREVYELEGHTAIRVVDADRNMDMVVNWGVYDFSAPNFVGRFVAGETDYMCMAYPTRYFFADYEEQGRGVVEQTPALDSVQTERLIALIDNNLRPENKVYRYNYVLDNCATRPLALIEQAVGRQLIANTLTDTSFRREMQRYHADYPWYQFGIDLALGRGLDKPITLRQTAFAPVALCNLLEDSGVVEATAIHGEHTCEVRPTPWFLTPLAFALAVLAAAIGVCFVRRPQWFDSLLFGVFALTGCVLTYLVFVSTHEATSPNLLLLWLNPFCALGAVLPWIKKAKKNEMCYFFVNFVLLISLIVLAPVLGRGMNAAFWPLIAADAVRSLDNIRRCKKKANRS